jgi:hypothetical protein
MKEKIADLSIYLKENFWQILVQVLFLFPTIWMVCSTLNNAKIESLNSNINSLNATIEMLHEQNKLQQDKIEGYKDLVLDDHQNNNIDWKKIKSN